MRICVIEPIGIPDDEIRTGLPDHEVTIFDSRGWSDDELLHAAAGAQILAGTNRPISANVIAGSPDLEMIAVAGIDHVDPSATERGIIIRNAAGYAETAVAEWTIGMMISLARDIPRHNSDIRHGGLSSTGTELRGKTLGLVGGGSIGHEVSRLVEGFRIRTLVHDLRADVTLEAVFSEADFVALALPLTPATTGLVSDDLLNRMKPSAFRINRARGRIVDTDALVRALDAGRLTGAALDVCDVEPRCRPHIRCFSSARSSPLRTSVSTPPRR